MAIRRFFYSDNKPIIGKSLPIQRILSRIMQLADSMMPVLILGETGTGKELVAQAIHYNGRRKQKPFIAVNCAAIPENLAEGELFGHERGAFTDAKRIHFGRFELANEGTLFLDEVGELSPNIQAKLLRVLQEGEFFRIGGERPVKINARVICATNIDLPQAVAEKKFREDLFYRLRAARIKLVPLRERKEDIPLLAEHFLKKYNYQEDTSITGFSRKALELLRAYSWPGNIRELENVVWNAVVMRKRGNIQPDDLDLATTSAVTDKIEISIPAGKIEFQEFMKTATQTVARQLVELTLIKCNGDTTMARQMLGLKRWDNITRKYGLNLKELSQNHMDSPELSSLTFPPPETLPELTSRQKAAIQYLKANNSLTAEEYSRLTQTSRRTALREIKRLLGLNLISKIGSGYHTSYKISRSG